MKILLHSFARIWVVALVVVVGSLSALAQSKTGEIVNAADKFLATLST